MQVTETSADGLRREFTVVIPAKDLQDRMDARLQELGRNIRLPGFRPGKVPIPLLKQRYGKSVLGELVEKTVSDSSSRVMSERGLRAAVQPKIEIVSFGEGSDLEYKMALELIPEIEPGDFSSIQLERLVVQVGDAEVDQALQRIAERQKRSEPIAEPRPAREGDVVVIDFVGRTAAGEFPGGAATDHHLALGSGSFIPGFEEQLIGAAVGEHRDVKVAFPEDYPNKSLAGKEATFAVDVKEIREPVAATVDDALAQSLGAEDLEALRRGVREQIERDYAEVSRARLKRQLLDALAERHDFHVPEGLVEVEFNSIWRQIEADRAADRLDPEDQGKDEEALKAEYRAIASRRVKLGLLLSEVGRLNNLQVSQEEVTRAMLQEARRYPGQEKAVLEFYQRSPENMARLRAPLFEDRVIDFILDQVQMSERTVTPEQLAQEAQPQQPEAAEQGGS